MDQSRGWNLVQSGLDLVMALHPSATPAAVHARRDIDLPRRARQRTVGRAADATVPA
jgi:hypothetical protein